MLALVSLASAFLSPASAWADASRGPLTLSVPCSDGGAAAPGGSGAGMGFRPCKDVLANGSPEAPTPLSRIKKIVQSQVDGYYGMYSQTLNGTPTYHPESGVDYDFLSPPGRPFGPTVCNLNENTLVLKNGAPFSERTVDHLGKSCGSSMEIKVEVSVNKVAGCAAGKPTFSSEIIYTATKGSLEEGYFRGTLVQATACYLNNVLKEIQNKKAITVGSIAGITSPCLGIAQDIERLSKEFRELIQSLIDSGSSPVEALQKCSDKAPKSETDPNSLNTLHLCSTQQSLEDAFVHLSTCEIFGRAQNSYLNHTAKQQAHDDLIKKLISELNKPCADFCSSKFYKASDTCHKVPSNQQISECITSCYQAKMPDLLKNHFQTFWPSDESGACQ